MSISSYNIDSGPYNGTGTTDTFSYDFPIEANTELSVFKTVNNVRSTLTLTTDYTVTGVGDAGGGTVVLTAGNLATGEELYIVSNRDFTQPVSFGSQTSFFPIQHQEAFNKLTMQVQQLQNRLLKAVRLATGDNNSISEMAELTANSFLQVNGTADGINQTTLSAAGVVAEVSVQNHAAVRALTSASYTDGQVIFVTDVAAPAGYFVVRTGTVTDDDLEFIVFTDDSNRYAQRVGGNEFALSQEAITINFTSDADITLTATQNKYGRYIFTDTGVVLTTTRYINISAEHRNFVITNDTAETLRIWMGVGSWYNLAANETKYLYGDATTAVTAQPPNNNNGFGNGYAVLRTIKSSGTDAGTFTSGSWQNVEIQSGAGTGLSVLVLVAPFRFLLKKGVYIIKWRAPGYRCDDHQTRLYDYTNSAVVNRGEGSSEHSSSSGGDQTWSHGVTTVTVTVDDTAYELQHRCQTTSSTNGMGSAVGFGINEIYASIEIYKIV